MGVLTVIAFSVYVTAPDLWKLPHELLAARLLPLSHQLFVPGISNTSNERWAFRTESSSSEEAAHGLMLAFVRDAGAQ